MKPFPKQLLFLCLSLVVLGLHLQYKRHGRQQKRRSTPSCPPDPDAPAPLDIDWNKRAELEAQLSAMAEQYQNHGAPHVWQERDLWCLEITNDSAEEKTGNRRVCQHPRGERESASSAMYTAWWLTLCARTRHHPMSRGFSTLHASRSRVTRTAIAQCLVINNRPNLRPKRSSSATPTRTTHRPRSIAATCRLRYSPDWDGNGVWATIRARAIDMDPIVESL